MHKTALFLVLAFLLFLSTLKPQLTNALTMSDNNYILQMGTFNTTGGLTTGSGKRLNVTLGQTANGLYTGTNYTIRSGFQYVSSIIPFTFNISNLTIDFGTLTAGSFTTRTNTLTVSNGSAYGFVVTAFENHQLLITGNGALIPDTTCDSGTCSESSSGTWSNPLTYGFGYRCDVLASGACASGFTSSTSYKQFADNSKGETTQTVMTNGTTASRNNQVQITYQVNVSNTQAAGLYNNVITYIATPTF